MNFPENRQFEVSDPLIAEIERLEMIRLWNLLVALMAVSGLFISADAGEAQVDRSAQLTIANSTNATLTVIVNSRSDYRETVVTLAPISERRIVVPAGYITVIAVSSRSAPIRSHNQGFALSTGRRYTVNLTPKDFGTTYLADRPKFDPPGSGITTNKSRQAQLSRPKQSDKNAWLNLGCYNYYMSKVINGEGFVPNGRRQATFVAGFNSSKNKYACQVANTYGDWAAQDAKLVSNCNREADNCKVLKRWREN